MNIMDKMFKIFIFSFAMVVIMPFLGLIGFQKYQMEKNMPPSDFYFIQEVTPPQQTPPNSIPIFCAVFSCFCLCAIWYKLLDKTFLTPLNEAILNLQKYSKGDKNITFKTKSENKQVIEIFDTLNKMVESEKLKEKLQNIYIQNIVHDLKAPILAQDRALNILADEFGKHELVVGMQKNTKDYIEIINLILEYQNAQIQNLKIEKTKINIKNLINDIIAALKPLADEKNIEITTQISDDNVKIYADQLSLTRILTNLITNSIENIANNCKIKIEAKENLISIKDNGCGIEQEKIATIFDRYATSKTGLVSGLGLHITKELAEKNGAQIKVESKINHGTNFTIVFDCED